MNKMIKSLLAAILLGAPLVSWAGNPTADAMLGGALGGALGAGVGSELGGRDGAILGGALGGAAGTAITTRRYRQYDYDPGYRDYGPPSYYRNPGRHRGHYKRYYRERRYDRYYD